MKFDTNNSAHVALLNNLFNKYSAHFRGAFVYVSDVVRDVEALMDMTADGCRYVIVGETCTVQVTEEKEARDLLRDCSGSGLRAILRVTRETSRLGNVYWRAEEIE